MTKRKFGKLLDKMDEKSAQALLNRVVQEGYFICPASVKGKRKQKRVE